MTDPAIDTRPAPQGSGRNLRRLAGLLIAGVLASDPAFVQARAAPGKLPAPMGSSPCAASDPIVTTEARVATTVGGKLAGCFRVGRTTATGAPKPEASTPEYAIAIDLAGGAHTPADLDNMLSAVRQQWKDFKPLSEEFQNYTAWVNDLVKDDGAASPATLSSIKPVLVSIDRLDAKAYAVISIRSHQGEVAGKTVSMTNVSAAAVVLRGSKLLRLEWARPLTDASDIDHLQSDVAEWVRAIEAAG